MKKLRLLLWMQLLLLPLIVFSSFSGCEGEEEEIIVENPEVNDSIPLDKPEQKDSVQMPEKEAVEYVLYNNLGTKNWTYLAAISSGEIMLIKEDSTGDFSAAKFIDGEDTVHCKMENTVDKVTLTLNSRDCTLGLACIDESVVLFQNDWEVIESFALTDVIKATRAEVSNNKMVNIMFGEIVGGYLDMIPVVSNIIDALETMKLLYETDDMNHHEKVDYIENEGYKLFSTDIFGPEEVEKIAPTYFIGIHTGDAEVNGLTAKCYIAGYLRAEANDGEFNFDYGICLSTSSNPSLSDEVQKHTAVSGMINSIDVDLSLPYTFADLKNNTTYYYRAFFKNNLDGRVEYADEIKSFKTEIMLCPDDNHPHAIDLGLPSGTKWACCNVGASKPEEYGTYLNFTNATSAPSREQIEELIKYTSKSHTHLNGVLGSLFRGQNGRQIFLPAAGQFHPAHQGNDQEFYDRVGTAGFYYSSTKVTDESNYYEYKVYGLYFESYSWQCSSSAGCWHYRFGQSDCIYKSLRQVR